MKTAATLRGAILRTDRARYPPVPLAGFTHAMPTADHPCPFGGPCTLPRPGTTGTSSHHALPPHIEDCLCTTASSPPQALTAKRRRSSKCGEPLSDTPTDRPRVHSGCLPALSETGGDTARDDKTTLPLHLASECQSPLESATIHRLLHCAITRANNGLLWCHESVPSRLARLGPFRSAIRSHRHALTPKREPLSESDQAEC